MKQTSILIAILFLFLVSCDEDKPIRKGLDKTGEELVLLTLHAGIHDKDLVDCYFGDLEIDSTLDYKIIDLKVELKELYKRIEKIIPKNKSEEFRKNYQLALTHSVFTRMRIADYESITFMEECENLYQFTPKLNSFTYYDSLLNELDKVLPGEGDIRYRLAEYKSRYEIPQSRIDKSYRAGIRKSAEITRKHIKLPPNEEIEVKYIDNAPWNAYNWYQGNYKSLIEINNIQSIYLERIIDLSAHEAYPGHHVYYALREKKFYRDSGYIEFSIYPLFTPITFLAEGLAEFGNEIAFPQKEKIRFLMNEIDSGYEYTEDELLEYFEVVELVRKLTQSNLNVTKMYLDNEIDADSASQLIQKYSIGSEHSSHRRIRFLDQYRTYIISYTLGKEVIKDYIESKAGKDLEKQWEVYKELLVTPYLPKDLMP